MYYCNAFFYDIDIFGTSMQSFNSMRQLTELYNLCIIMNSNDVKWFILHKCKSRLDY